MDHETQELVELIKSGLDAKGAADVIKAKRLLATDGGTNGHAVSASSQITLWRASEGVEVKQDSERSVREILDELVAAEDVLTAPVGTVWQIPTQRLISARKGSKTGNRYRTPKQALSCVSGVMRARGQSHLVALQRKGVNILVERIHERD